MINLDKVSKKFSTGVSGLSEISFFIDKGEFVFLVGPTGAGKTTIFKLLIRETLPTQGNITVNELDVVKLPSNKTALLRRKVGVIFQDLKLMFGRTIIENVMLPLEVINIKLPESKKKAEEALIQVGLIEHKDKFPIQLSGGEMQRVAIARAIVLSPEILLADEPTGNLDTATSWEIMKLLADINQKGTTVIMATHNLDIVKSLDKRVIGLEKGKLIRDDKTKDKQKEEKSKEKKEEKK